VFQSVGVDIIRIPGAARDKQQARNSSDTRSAVTAAKQKLGGHVRSVQWRSVSRASPPEGCEPGQGAQGCVLLLREISAMERREANRTQDSKVAYKVFEIFFSLVRTRRDGLSR